MRGGGQVAGDDERARVLDAVLVRGDHAAPPGRVREGLLDLGLRRVVTADPETVEERRRAFGKVVIQVARST
jgi:hypothetical protein